MHLTVAETVLFEAHAGHRDKTGTERNEAWRLDTGWLAVRVSIEPDDTAHQRRREQSRASIPHGLGEGTFPPDCRDD